MAVIVSNGATDLSAASAFYRAESYNLSSFSTTYLSLSSSRTQAVTFANAGNCQGLIIHLAAAYAHITRDVTVVLEENVASVWTARATKTLTAAQISNSVANTTQATWIVPFIFGTPYAVDTTASKWRFSISQGSGSNNWQLRTSNGTAISYVTWCNNALSYTSGDVLVAKDRVTIDQTCRFDGLLSTGDAVNSVCGIACSSNTGVYSSNGMIVWDTTPSASFTMTINGLFLFSAHAGFHVGDASNRIPYAQKAVVEVIAATAGTAINSGLSMNGNYNHAAVIGRMNIQMYGEIPTTRSAILNADAASGQPNIVTTTSTGWANGDSLIVTKANTQGAPTETVPFTINSIAGANITLNANLPSAARKAGGHVVRLNGYGVEFKTTHTAPIVQYYNGINNLVFSGAWVSAFCSTTTNGTSQWLDDTANVGYLTFEDSAFSNGSVAGGVTLLNATNWGNTTMTIQRCHFFRASPTGAFYGPVSPLKNFVDNIFFISTLAGFTRLQNMTIDGNYFYNPSATAMLNNTGLYNSTITDNYFWGSASGSIRNDGTMANVVWRNNYHNQCPRVFWNWGSIFNVQAIDEKYGSEVGTFNVYTAFDNYSPFADIVILNSDNGTAITPTSGDTQGVDGTKIRFQNYDQVANTDFTYMPYGTIVRTGTGLADTTVRTAGGFAMRFEPIYSPNLMHWEQNIPTGNIQNKTMTISCWVKLNNAAYYAGTHTKPTLTVNYDNGTTVSAVATTGTSWQQLAVTFTPTTTYGQVTMSITGATDATGTNRYFYVDDFNVAYPAGVAIDLGNLDLWADGLPVAPAIATVPSLGGVWDEPLSAHTVSGSFGWFVKKLLTVSKFLGLK